MKSPLRILAVDGGGVGGIIPARVLERLQATHSDLVARADLVAGTSTGGLIALGLAAGKTPADLCALYQEHAKDIFSPAHRRGRLRRLWRAKFKPDGLRDAVRAIIGDRTLGDLTAKPVLVPVTALNRADTRHRPAGIFLSTAYRLSTDPIGPQRQKYESSHWPCVDVALATAAAPTFFPAHVVEAPGPRTGKWVCWDGGLVANNPALAAYGEVLRLDALDRTGKDPAPPQLDVRVLSLGTGFQDLDIEPGDWGLVQSARPVVATLMDASVGSTTFLLSQVLANKVLRISPKLKADYEMDDPTAVDRLNAEAVAFVDKALRTGEAAGEADARLSAWLTQYWFDPPPAGPRITSSSP
jgi:hypothetical protein